MTGRSAIRYRPWQSLVVLLLSAVVAGTAVLAPLYDRAVQEAMVRDLVSDASPQVAGVLVRSTGRFDDRGASAPLATSTLVRQFPGSVRAYFRDPISTVSTSVAVDDPKLDNPVGSLLVRDDQCDHVELESGSCPAAAGEVAISTADAEVFGWRVGDRVVVTESSQLLDPPSSAHRARLEVVGIYRPSDPDELYWAGRPPTGRAGLMDAEGVTHHDGWLTSPDTMHAGSPPPPDGGRWSGWVASERLVDLLLDRDAIGVDEMFALAEPIEKFIATGLDTTEYEATAEATSGISLLTERAETGRHNAHRLVPLFVVQLALLAALTLWLVLGAAVEQRRPEVAVVRLRGGDARSCRRLLVGELGPPMLVGWLLGLVLAAGALLVVGRRWLDPDLGLEITPLAVATGVGVLIVEGLMLLAATWSVVTASATDLLRRVRPRTGWALSMGTVVAVLMCGSAFAATAAGSLTGWVATAAPTLLAIAVGLALGFLIGPVAGRAGSALLARGRLLTGLGLVQMGRRHGMRTAIATIVAAAALLAFAVNALAVGERNRADLAKASVGAPTVVLAAGGTDLAVLRRAVRDLDPSGASATVAVAASAPAGMTTLAVVPEEYARIAAFKDPADGDRIVEALEASALEPLELRGTLLSLAAGWHGRASAPLAPGAERPVDVEVTVVQPDRKAEQVSLEAKPGKGRTVTWATADLPCDDGCWLTGLVVGNKTEAAIQGTMRIHSLSVDGQPVELGDPDDWAEGTPHDNGFARPRAAPQGLAFNVGAERGFDARLGHLSAPARLAAVTTGPLPPDSAGKDFTSVGLDGVNRDMHQVGTQSYLPGAPANAALVDLDVLERDGVDVDPGTRMRVFLDDSISGEAAVETLEDHGVAVDNVTTIADTEDDFRHSAPAWALQLGVVTAAAAALLAALVLAISFITSWRLRSADAVAVRLNGVSRRRATVVAVLETVPLVAVSVLLGLACGIIGSRIALPDLPFFDSPPPLPIEDLATSWAAVLGTGAALLAALVLLAAGAGLRLGRQPLSRSAEEA